MELNRFENMIEFDKVKEIWMTFAYTDTVKEMIKNIVLDMGNVLLSYDPHVILNKVCEINATTAKFRECSLDDADSIIYNTLLNEYNRQPTAVLLEGDKDYTPYTIAKIEYGDAAGYKITPLTIPDGMDLIGQPGEPLTSILDKIKNIFSNF